MTADHAWDFFIAHAGGDKEAAERLHDALAPRARAFLDTRCLKLGDDWDTELPAAQRASLISVVLVSSKTEQAYYQREEIAAAIALARKGAQSHRVVPIYLDSEARESDNTPYGLRAKHGLQLSQELTLEDAAERLLATLEQLRKGGGASAPVAAPAVRPRAQVGTRRRILLGAGAAAVALLALWGAKAILAGPRPPSDVDVGARPGTSILVLRPTGPSALDAKVRLTLEGRAQAPIEQPTEGRRHVFFPASGASLEGFDAELRGREVDPREVKTGAPIELEKGTRIEVEMCGLNDVPFARASWSVEGQPLEVVQLKEAR